MRRPIQIILVLLLLSITAGAQPPVQSQGQMPEQLWESLRRLGVGERIRVVDQELKSETGRFVGFSEEAIVFQVGQDETTIQKTDVFRVTSLERTRRGRNLLIGLGIGALAGAVFMGVVTSEDDFLRGFAVVSGTLISGAIGAGVGAAFPSHPTIYRAERKEGQRGPSGPGGSLPFKYLEEFRGYEHEAREAQRGLWKP